MAIKLQSPPAPFFFSFPRSLPQQVDRDLSEPCNHRVHLEPRRQQRPHDLESRLTVDRHNGAVILDDQLRKLEQHVLGAGLKGKDVLPGQCAVGGPVGRKGSLKRKTKLHTQKQERFDQLR
eukprot:TRINITY_DN446_c0_g1_i5.p2 TRINITY_DN446_c0_g1~~TRINITY_DN446_c0_g1_i5.p2  ORF type:complete len:121 (-),score=1.51 TRINITY_DN446_c0_g1_i5:185-547(-)